MKKSVCIILTLLYFFTAQLTVHAFAMHWWLHWNHHNTHTEAQHHCWHTHDSSNKDKEDSHDMSLCLEQSMWAFVEYMRNISDTITKYIYQPTYTFFSNESTEEFYSYSLHDPWWGEDWNFSEYLDQLYGHGIVMHC